MRLPDGLTQKDWIVCLLIAFIGAAIATQSIEPGHRWGDDWAGYMLQAIAIENGDLDGELELNKKLLLETPVQLGPYAYPWGLPTLLWVASKIVGFDVYLLKFAQIFVLFLTAVFIYFLARLYLSPPLSALSTSLIIFQPFIIGFTDNILADLPLLAISAFTFYLIEIFHRKFLFSFSKEGFFLLIFIALLSIIAFSIKSNGVFLAPAHLAISLFIFIQQPKNRNFIVAYGIVFLVSFCIFLTMYFKIFPDGSLVHANYLTIEPTSLLRRSRDTIKDFQAIIPIYPFSGIPSFIILVLLGVLTFVGIFINRPVSAGMLAWCVLNTFLIVSYRYSEGPRYIFPLLIPISIFSVAGISFILKNVTLKLRIGSTPLLSRGFIFVVISGVAVLSIIFQDIGKYTETTAPYSEEMDQVVSLAKERIPKDAKVAFFRPRAFRLLTGRESIIVNDPSQVERVDYFVINKKVDSGYNSIKKGGFQLSGEYFESSGQGAFDKMFENDHYVIFNRK